MKKLLTLLLAALLLVLAVSPAFASFDYDGTGDGHVANNPNAPQSSTYSVCFWVKIPTIDDDEQLVSYGNGIASSAGRGWDIITKTNGTLRWNAYDSATSVAFATTTVALSDATQHHVCLVRVSLFAHNVYIDATDGVVDEVLAIDPNVDQNSTDDFTIGEPIADDFAAHARLVGRMAHAAYWTVALSGAEVASLADKSTCPTSVQASNIKVFVPLTTDPAVETAQALSVTTNGNPVFQTGDPTGLPCGAAPASGTTARMSTLGVGN